MKKLKSNEDNEYFFRLCNGDYLHLQYFEYNDEEMTSNCVTIDLIKEKDVCNFYGIEQTNNKLPVWDKDKPVIIKLDVSIGTD